MYDFYNIHTKKESLVCERSVLLFRIAGAFELFTTNLNKQISITEREKKTAVSF